MRMIPGADQPAPPSLRQNRYPLPYFPPMMKAAFFTPGTITMQCAFSSNSCGMARSGVAITSENTVAFVQAVHRFFVARESSRGSQRRHRQCKYDHQFCWIHSIWFSHTCIEHGMRQLKGPCLPHFGGGPQVQIAATVQILR